MSIDIAKAFQKHSYISVKTRVDIYTRRYQLAYFHVFLIGLLFCWSPSKPLAYLTPGVAIVWFLIISRSRNTLYRLLLSILLWLIATSIYLLLTPGFVVHSAFLALLTYGSFLFIVAVPTRPIASDQLMTSMLSVARWVVPIQGGWGIIQGVQAAARFGTFDGAVGDFVAGTIDPSFTRSSDFSNPMFAVNIALMLIVLLPSLITERKGKLAFVIGLVSLVLASVLHVLLFFAIAFVLALVVYYPSFFLRRSGYLILIGFALIGFLAFNLLSKNFSTVNRFIQYTLDGQTPRAQVVVRTFTSMPAKYSWMPLIGFGPGQFSSRASLIGTGLFFGGPANPKQIPLLPQGMSDPFEENILDLWLTLSFSSRANDTSSTNKPFFSWLSVYTEFGGIGFGITLIFYAWLLRKAKRYARTPTLRLEAASFGMGITLLFILGVQENYWEVTQAIFIGLVLLKLQYANLVYGKSHLSSNHFQPS